MARRDGCRDSIGKTRGLTRAPVGWLYVYFYGTEDGSEVKVGHTKQPPSFRRRQHENEGHVIFYFGPAPTRFAESFRHLGTVFAGMDALVASGVTT